MLFRLFQHELWPPYGFCLVAGLQMANKNIEFSLWILREYQYVVYLQQNQVTNVNGERNYQIIHTHLHTILVCC